MEAVRPSAHSSTIFDFLKSNDADTLSLRQTCVLCYFTFCGHDDVDDDYDDDDGYDDDDDENENSASSECG